RLQGARRDDAHRIPARMLEWNAEGAVRPLAFSEIGKPVEELISRDLNPARQETHFHQIGIAKFRLSVRIDLDPRNFLTGGRMIMRRPKEKYMMVVARILTFALPVVIVIATLEGLLLAVVMRRNYNWRAYFASLADALGRQYVVLTFLSLSLAAPAYDLAYSH